MMKTEEEIFEEMHSLPHWSVWVIVVLVFLGGGFAVSLFQRPCDENQNSMEEISPPSVEKMKIEKVKADLFKNVKSLKTKERELKKINEDYESKVEGEKRAIEILQYKNEKSTVPIDSMSAVELYDFFANVFKAGSD